MECGEGDGYGQVCGAWGCEGAEGRRRGGVRADSPSASSRRAEGSSSLVGLGTGVARGVKN